MIDSHCHLDFSDFDHDREALLQCCHQQGIEQFIVPGVTAEGWAALMALVEGHVGLFGALGLHPMFLAQHRDADLERLRHLLTEWPAIAVGEIGLDFYHGEQQAARQCELFEAQLKIAKAFQLPVILHVRKAHDRVLAALRRIGGFGGIVHAFAGSLQQAQQYQQLGFLLGVGGAVTYPRANRLRRTLAELPLEALVLESDAPDMRPAMAKEHRNTPLVLSDVVTVLSELHQCSRTLILQKSTASLEAMFPALLIEGKLS